MNSWGPLVSILIPCYNAERWVGTAIESALEQTYPRTEVIVLDDGSTDKSLEEIKSFGDRIRWESGPNRGANVTRNRLLELSRGEWIQFLDADDYIMPRKIEVQIELALREGADLVVSPALSDKGQILQNPSTRDPWIDLINREFGNTVANFFRKSAVLAAGGWNPEQPVCQEYEMMSRMLMSSARVAYCDRYLAICYRVNPESIYRQDAARGLIAHGRIIEQAVDFLERTGRLTSERRNAATVKAFALAQRLWQLRNGACRELEKIALRIEPELGKKLGIMRSVYGFFYRVFGFEFAQRYGLISRAARNVCGAVWPLSRRKRRAAVG